MKAGLRILYAEDNALDADLTRTYFSEHAPEFEIETVETGQACLDRLSGTGCDLVLLDHRLPDMEGLDVLRALVRTGVPVPVVLVTGSGDEDLVVKALHLGAANYVPKLGNYLETLPDLLRLVIDEHRLKLSQGRIAAGPRRILYVEHHAMDIDLTLRHFAEAAPQVELDVIRTCADALTRLGRPPAYDAALVDLRMPDKSGLDFVREAKRRGLTLPPFIMISGKGDEGAAIASLTLGAADYVAKREGYLDQLPYTIDRAIVQERLNRVNAQLQAELAERRRVEARILEQRATLNAILESADSPIFSLDREYRYTAFNRAHAVVMKALYGTDIQLGGCLSDYQTLPEDWHRTKRTLDRALNGETVLESIRSGDKALSRRYFEVAHNPVRTEAGEIIGASVFARDVTARKSAEEELRFKNLILSTQQEASIDGILVVDVNGGIISSNRRFGEMWGVPLDIMESKSEERALQSMTDKLTDPEEFVRTAKHLYASPDEKSRDEIALKDGRTFEWYSAPMCAAEGTHFGRVWSFRDITARKQAEDALRTSERFLAQSQQLAHFGNWMVDLETGTLTWSEEMYRMYGVSSDTFVPTEDSFVALIHPDDRPAMLSLVEDLPRSGKMPRHEFRVVRPDGTIRAIEGYGEVQVDAENKPTLWIGAAHDITERKLAEDGLRRSIELLDQTGRLAKVGGWELDLDTQTLHWTAETYRIHEIDPATQPSVTEAIRFYAPEARPVITAAVQAAIESGTPFDLELPLVTGRGRRVWVYASGIAESRVGKPIRLYGAFQDISERRRMDELRRLQSAALHAAPEGIVITDRAGAIDWVNPAFTQLTGYSAEEALGRNWRDFVELGRHTPAFFKELWEAILGGRTWQGEMINRRKDGRLYTADQVVAPILDASGAITHFVVIAKDITERLRFEAQFRQAQKMESVGLLTSGIAHDFNNLLTVINGTSDLLLAQVGPDDPMSADLQTICNSGERAATLTRQLLAFSRQQILEPRVMNFNTLVAGLESLLRRLVGEDIDLVVVPTPGLGSVKADPGQIEQVIINLTVNAQDAMPQGGQLTIETQNVEIDVDYARQHGVAVPPGSYVRLVVSDSGIGMDEATRVRIFEPFFTTKGPGQGTGLGLSTVYGIVKQSQGFIWVYSEVGHGTSFTILLPRVTDEAGTAPARSTPVSSTGTETILLVEDNAGLRRLATRLLEPAGYTVLGAATGEEALRLAERREEPVHLLLSDVVMPGMSGRQLAERLAQTRPGMKVLYMSGYTDDTVVRHGVLDAKVPFINKPFTAAALLRKVREVLDS